MFFPIPLSKKNIIIALVVIAAIAVLLHYVLHINPIKYIKSGADKAIHLVKKHDHEDVETKVPVAPEVQGFDGMY